MKRIFAFACIFFASVALISGCRSRSVNEIYEIKAELVKKAQADIPVFRELTTLYPGADVGIYSKNFEKGSTKAQVNHIIYDRYLLTITVGFEVNSNDYKITSCEEPLITLSEIVSVDGKAEGPLKETYGTTIKVSPAQWQKIFQSGGAFVAAGIDIRTNAPVNGIEKLKQHLRNAHTE